MEEKIQVKRNTEPKKFQKPFILFMVFFAIMTGLILTSVALGVFGNIPILINRIPLAIFLVGIFPLHFLYRKTKKT